MKLLTRICTAIECLLCIAAIGFACLWHKLITRFTRRKERNHVAARIARLRP